MREMDDMALLREYQARQSETAFTTLVERHIGLVYCAALRQVRDPALAQEITQVVFILLARKAHSLREGTILSAWLYRAVRFTASDARKMAFRRQQREHEAAQMQTNSPSSSDESAWEQIAPLLDEAMAALGEKDRNAVMLRFFEQKSLEEVGAALGIDTGAAQKRVWRAVDKLRQYFARHGAAFSAATITTALSAHALHAVPSGLAATVAATAALKGTAATASTATLLKTTLKLMAWTKAKTAIVVGAGILFAAGTTTITVKEIEDHRTYPWQVHEGLIDFNQVKQPPQVRILHSTFQKSAEYSGDTLVGTGASAQDVIAVAYGFVTPARAMLPGRPAGRPV
jgi:RNA polymerase sigma factor (sigma-70 family)